MSSAQRLRTALDMMQVPLAPERQQQCLAYLALLQKWNRVYNLTAVREPEKMLTHHLLDSLAVVPYIGGGPIADVGSGAGLPGIPLAIARPEWPITLIEANGKKATFLRQAVAELALTNVVVEPSRVEHWQSDARFQVVISRAFSDLAEFAMLAARLCAADGVLMAMKGVHPFEELAQLPAGVRVQNTIRLAVPELDAERHLVLLSVA